MNAGSARDPAITLALLSALLFGTSTPLAKLLLEQAGPWMLAGVLYLGSGIGLAAWRLLRRAERVRMGRREWAWLAAAVLFGGILGPVLLMTALARMPGSSASLLLNAEGALTAVLAWVVFRENVDRRVALGMLAIVAGAAVLSWPGRLEAQPAGPALLVLAACLAWAIDNNLTRKVAAADASFIAMVKGLVAGTTNVAIALLLGSAWPAPAVLVGGGLVGLVGYGLSLVLFVVALRHLGTARTGAYFSVAPFFGAVVSVLLLGEPVDGPLLAAVGLMALGVWLHVTERHAHSHRHQPLQHVHEHVHRPVGEDHHDHPHPPGTPPTDARDRHSHAHAHAAMTHSHPHFPDLHHRHPH
jgi:drug/metabolite transporter (DMT)-like permease